MRLVSFVLRLTVHFSAIGNLALKQPARARELARLLELMANDFIKIGQEPDYLLLESLVAAAKRVNQ
jgi:hypothetical protein